MKVGTKVSVRLQCAFSRHSYGKMEYPERGGAG